MTGTLATTAKANDLTQDELQAMVDRAVNQRLADWLRHEAEALDLANAYTWAQIRALHPNVWVLVEALDAFTDEEHGKRIIPHLRLIQAFGDDWHAPWEAYKVAHHADMNGEYYMLHTVREVLDIGVLDPFGRRLRD